MLLLENEEKKMKKLICLLIVLGLASSASALTISTTVSWSGEHSIHEKEGGGVEITASGDLTVDGRVNLDGPGWIIIRGGGVMRQINNNDGLKLPDDDQGSGNTPKIYIEGGGLLETVRTESIRDRLYADGGVYMGASASYRTGLVNENTRNDPQSNEWQFFNYDSGTGVEFTDEGGNVTLVHGTPEPATIALLGMGSLVLLRRRR
jgi:hypothetical protein